MSLTLQRAAVVLKKYAEFGDLSCAAGGREQALRNASLATRRGQQLGLVARARRTSHIWRYCVS